MLFRGNSCDVFIVWFLYDRAADSKLSYLFVSQAERCFEVVWRIVALAAGNTLYRVPCRLTSYLGQYTAMWIARAYSPNES
jgi:hypothetical protein